MSRFLFLDSGPLGLLLHPRQTEEVMAITAWLSQMLKQGRRVLVPAIVYYELKRELLRADKSLSLNRLDLFAKASNRYIPLSDEALRLSAELWATARQRGWPTADSRELDIDVILAAQGLLLEQRPVKSQLRRRTQNTLPNSSPRSTGPRFYPNLPVE